MGLPGIDGTKRHLEPKLQISVQHLELHRLGHKRHDRHREVSLFVRHKFVWPSGDLHLYLGTSVRKQAAACLVLEHDLAIDEPWSQDQIHEQAQEHEIRAYPGPQRKVRKFLEQELL